MVRTKCCGGGCTLLTRHAKYCLNYMAMTHPILSPQTGLEDFTGVEGQSGKIMCQGGKPDTGKFTHLILV